MQYEEYFLWKGVHEEFCKALGNLIPLRKENHTIYCQYQGCQRTSSHFSIILHPFSTRNLCPLILREILTLAQMEKKVDEMETEIVRIRQVALNPKP